MRCQIRAQCEWNKICQGMCRAKTQVCVWSNVLKRDVPDKGTNVCVEQYSLKDVPSICVCVGQWLQRDVPSMGTDVCEAMSSKECAE